MRKVQKQFSVRLLGEPTKFLGMEITYMREQGLCCVSQRTYIEKLVSVFLSDHDATSTFFPTTPMETRVYDKLELARQEPDFVGPYRSIVGGLLFLFVCTRVDIGFAVSILTQHLACPKPTHFLLAKRVLHYLQGTKTHGLLLGGEVIQSLVAFSDASFANDPFDRRSMGGYIIFLGNSPISWAAKKHRGIQALSSTESEIIQIAETCKELLWLQPLLRDLGFTSINWETLLNGDNQPATHVIMNNPTHSGRSKHMDVKIKFCGEVLAKKETILLKYVPTKYNFADIFTKALSTVRFRDLRSVMLQNLDGIINNSRTTQRNYNLLNDFAQTSPMSKAESPALN